tara:strand:- start:407 stop:940 length:534 start_codon:yes stop_codon:yes gene_type:complete
MPTSKTSDTIKKRPKANDIFITPLDLALKHINKIQPVAGELWLDPCKNSGAYYNQFPDNVEKDYCEILENKDFFEYEGKPDVICANPPYSLLDAWFKKTLELNPRAFSMLIGINNLTARRLEWCEKAGYGLTSMTMCKIYKWFGMSIIVVFQRGASSIIDNDRKVYRTDQDAPEHTK